MFTGKNGMSSIEFLSIIAILGVLIGFAIIITNPVDYVKKRNDQQRKSDISRLAKVLNAYYKDRSRYPSSLNYQIMDFKTNTPINWGDAWIPYMDYLPKDPSSSRKYAYLTANNNQSYYLYASLESQDDPQLCTSGGPGVCGSFVQLGISQNICGTRCNYGVSSSNTLP